jgi:hypothetical protein
LRWAWIIETNHILLTEYNYQKKYSHPFREEIVTKCSESYGIQNKSQNSVLTNRNQFIANKKAFELLDKRIDFDHWVSFKLLQKH